MHHLVSLLSLKLRLLCQRNQGRGGSISLLPSFLCAGTSLASKCKQTRSAAGPGSSCSFSLLHCRWTTVLDPESESEYEFTCPKNPFSIFVSCFKEGVFSFLDPPYVCTAMWTVYRIMPILATREAGYAVFITTTSINVFAQRR